MNFKDIIGSTLFVVDDNKENLKVLVQYLSDLGLKVVPLKSGEEVLALIRNRIPDMILLDIMMPGGIDGYETCRRLKTSEATKDIPVIFMSALTETIDKVTGFNLGAVDYITKPIEAEELKSRIHTHLSINRLQKELFKINVVLEEKVLARTEELKKSNVQLKDENAKRKQMEVELQERAARLELIADMGRRTTAILELHELLRQTVNLIQETFDYYYVVILLAEGSHIVFKATTLPNEKQYIDKARLKIGVESITGSVAKSGKPLNVCDVSKDKRYCSEFKEVKTKSELAVPIRLKEKIIGVLDAQSDQLNAFKKIDIFTLQTIADQLAIAIENAGMYEEAQAEIAERKRTEELLQESQRFLKSIVENIPDMIFVKDAKELRFISFNKSGEKLLGYGRGELIGKNDYDIFPENEADFFQVIDREVLLNKHKIDIPEEEIQTKNLGKRILHTKKIPILDNDGNPQFLLGISEDITEKKMAEEEIRKLSLSVEQSPASIVITDLHGNIEYVNPKFCEITGYSFAEVQGENPRVLISGEMPTEEYMKLWDTISSGKVWRGEFQNIKKNGELFWESAVLSPIKNEKGEITHYLAVKEDITGLKTLQRQFQQAQKMEAVGKLAGGVAHDFNNILTVINGYSDILLSQLHADDPIRKDLEQIQEAGERASTLTTQLLAFSRRQVIQPKVINLNTIVTDIEKMLRRLIGENVELETVLGSDLANIEADKGQMDQILMNLAVNARDAMPDIGKLTIETANVDIDEGYVKNHVSARSGCYIMLAVSDNGCGMDKETQAKIFDPFFTTKEHGKGTGLGLCTVYGIVKQNGGYIWVYSEPGQGTTFKIYFPIVDKTVKAEKGIPYSAKSLEGTEVILLVDDDHSVCEFTRDSLTIYGYKTLVANNGEEALSIFNEHKAPIHLIITDVIMPKMGGRELEKNISRLNPEVKVLFVSGYPDNAIMHHGVLEKGVAFLEKPYGPVSLVRKVREVLDSSQNQ